MAQHHSDFPRLMVSALRGGSGKTILSVGILAAFHQRGEPVAPFKKGPDYIDAGWLALAAGRPCYNLDTFLIDEPQILSSFFSHTDEKRLALIEGNRGLYDCIRLEGDTSTAALSKLLKAPVLLCLDCTKSTRTMAAVVLGCLHFDPDTRIGGVILNRVAGARHEGILTRSIEHHCGIPVLGAVPKLHSDDFPERHMGLVPTPEHDWAARSVAAAARMATDHIDLDGIQRVANQTPCLNELAGRYQRQPSAPLRLGDDSPRIGVIRDSAFQFYYPENIAALAEAGARIEYFSPLSDERLPLLDGLYIGGGFPETHAEQLAQNRGFARDLRAMAEAGLPVYGECGGLMYLGEELILNGRSYPMCGVLPIAFGFSPRPQGHGYTRLSVSGQNPFFPVGTRIHGHEFHYSTVERWGGGPEDLAFSMDRGVGVFGKKDGVRYKNVLATYTHIHALGTPSWAGALVQNALKHKNKKGGSSPG